MKVQVSAIGIWIVRMLIWIGRQESRGVDVSRHMFSGSGHCQHYREHPHEYAFEVSKFVSKALARW